MSKNISTHSWKLPFGSLHSTPNVPRSSCARNRNLHIFFLGLAWNSELWELLAFMLSRCFQLWWSAESQVIESLGDIKLRCSPTHLKITPMLHWGIALLLCKSTAFPTAYSEFDSLTQDNKLKSFSSATKGQDLNKAPSQSRFIEYVHLLPVLDVVSQIHMVVHTWCKVYAAHRHQMDSR